MKISIDHINPLTLKALIQVTEVEDGVARDLCTAPFSVGLDNIKTLVGDLQEVAVMLMALKEIEDSNMGRENWLKSAKAKAKEIAQDSLRSILVGPPKEKPEEKKEA